MRILIMDEDPAALATSVEAWPEDAPQPSLCGDAAEAVSALQWQHAVGERFDLALLSVDGGADAADVAQRLRAIDPELPLVALSADPAATAAALPGPPDRTICLPRPLHPIALRQIAAAMAERRAGDHQRDALAARVAELEAERHELAAAQRHAVHLAMHDPLTGAPNRLAFLRALADRVRLPGRFAVAMIDLDRFKQVNDTLGHLAGDELIRQLAAILHRVAPPGAMVARLGGDEFAMLFDPADDAAATTAGAAVVDACRARLGVFGHAVRSGASVGVVVGEGGEGGPEGDDPTGVLRRADVALHHAKAAGRGLVCRFDAAMDEGVQVRRRIEQELEHALAAGELSLAFQPIVGRDRLALDGFEALVRWRSPKHGPISPATFVPVAEESNLIHALGDWIIGEALAAVRQWPGQFVSVNVSARQFRRHGFAQRLTAMARAADVAPGRVQLEITEVAIFAEPERAADTLARLRAAGFRVALDQFGAGYSSLYNLRSFALDCLKIDRSFVDRMGRERESAAIVHAIIHLGRALGLAVVAEGVENFAQVQALRLAGATQLQGFYFSRAVDAAQARAMAAEGMPTARLAG